MMKMLLKNAKQSSANENLTDEGNGEAHNHKDEIRIDKGET